MQQLLSYTTTIAFFSLNAATIQAVVLLNLMNEAFSFILYNSLVNTLTKTLLNEQ